MSTTLTRMPESPEGQAFWEGNWRSVAAGHEEQVRYFVVCPEDAAPSPAQLAFSARIGAVFSSCQDAARAFVASAVCAAPQQYGLDEAAAAAFRSRVLDSREGTELAPLGGAEATFYGSDEWFLRFTESPFPACSVLGVGIDFVGERPVSARCLDGDAAMEPALPASAGDLDSEREEGR